MGRPLKREATYDDLVALPDNVVGEILAGELYASPRPGPAHANASSVLGGDLNAPYQRGRGGPGGWWILDEPELHLASDVLVPDLAGWRRTRMPALPETAWFPLVPDWVCEVLSPSTRRNDRLLKQAIYAREGVGHLWFVDPELRTLEVFRHHEATWVLVGTWGDEAEVRAEPFEEVAIDLAGLWG